jgi:hypothetical protein
MLEEDRATLEALEPPPGPRTPEQKAESLRQLGAAGYLYAAATQVVGPAFDVLTWKAYLDRYLQAAGDPADPVERILLEQLALAHHALGRLHVRAGSREGVEETQAYLAAIARLLAEVRRTALALKAYREPAALQATATAPPARLQGPLDERQPGGERTSPEDELGSEQVTNDRDQLKASSVPRELPV